MTFIRKIKQGDRIRYAEVWNERHGKEVIQHHVQYLGSNPDKIPNPTCFNIEKVHFGYMAQLILKDAVAAYDVYSMLKGMGAPVKRRELRWMVLRYNPREKYSS